MRADAAQVRQVAVIAGARRRIDPRIPGEEGADQALDQRLPARCCARQAVRAAPASARHRLHLRQQLAARGHDPQKRTSRAVTFTVASATTSLPSAAR